MTPEQAKKILWARHGRQEGDAELQEALELLEKTPELRQWDERAGQFHSTVGKALREIEPPAGLKESILAESKMVRPSFTRRRWLYAAAAAALAAGVGLLLSQDRRQDERSFANFEGRMVGFALRQYSMDVETSSAEELRQRLAQAGAPADFPLPQPLVAAGLKGGAKLSWQGKPVAMVCFSGGEGKTLYLFAIEEESMAKASQVGAAELKSFRGVTTARWAEAGMVYLLVAPLQESELRQFLGQLGSMPISVAFINARAFEQPVIVRGVSG